jgi:hypothetical protein
MYGHRVLSPSEEVNSKRVWGFALGSSTASPVFAMVPVIHPRARSVISHV